MQAAMAYLRTLRDSRGLSQADIARVAGVESKQVYRWERGESEPSGSSLMAFVRAVQGRVEDVEDLILGSATEDEGKRLANQILSQGPADERERGRRRQAQDLL